MDTSTKDMHVWFDEATTSPRFGWIDICPKRVWPQYIADALGYDDIDSASDPA
jgi:hypothetical protein